MLGSSKFKTQVFGAAAVIIAAALAVLFVLPIQAHAMETERWTAKANQSGSSNDVMGNTPTRVTWQGQTSPDESLVQVVINLPEGSIVEAENVKTTVMEGLDRLDYASTASVDGSTVTVDFPEPTPGGSLIMIEFNRTLLPADGGTYGVSGSYTTVDGQTHPLPASDLSFDVIAKTPATELANWLSDQEWVQAWNSNKFLNLFFNPVLIVTSVPALISGWLVALGLVVISFPLAIPLGLIWSFLRMAKSRIPRAIGATYINIIRGTPLFLQIYILFFGMPLLGVKMDLFVLGIIVLVMNSSAYLAEIFRAGIQSINKGQFEAARSLGMNGAQTMFYVIIPQTVRRVIPTMTSEFILMYKDTSLLAAVGVMEIMMYAKTITAATGNVTPYIVAAGFYLIVTIPLTKFINTMEERMASGRRKSKKKLGGKTSAESLEPGSKLDVERTVRLSDTFAEPVAQDSLEASELEKASRNGNHISH